MCKEVLPGDSFKVNTQIFARLSPLLAPLMGRVDVYTHFFFVPTRLLWDEFEDFITGGEDGLQQPVSPFIKSQDLYAAVKAQYPQEEDPYEGSVPDYLGIPKTVVTSNNVEVSDLPFRALTKIYNDWYRDQNLGEEIDLRKDLSGNSAAPQTTQNATNWQRKYQLQFRAYKKDYFTSALPWAQRGAQVTLPLHSETTFNQKVPPFIGYNAQNQTDQVGAYAATVFDGPRPMYAAVNTGSNLPSNVNVPLYLNPDTIDVNSQGPTITELRRSIRVQEWLEASARGGARYIEQLLTHFGVRSSDARLQRSELLGGGRSPIIVSEVVQTSGVEVDNDNWSPQGTLAGKGVTAQTTHSFKRYFEEHGFLVCFLSILPKATYQQGLDRMWTRRDKFDYAWPEFANIGEQPILQKELYFTHQGAGGFPVGLDPNEKIFGYTPRYAEYKYSQSTVHGQFRNSLNFWHLGRIFDNSPGLNEKFVQCRPDDGFSRAFAVENTDHFMIQIYHDIKAKRVLPYYGTPQI